MSVKENLKYHTNFQVIESNVPPKNNRSGYKVYGGMLTVRCG